VRTAVVAVVTRRMVERVTSIVSSAISNGSFEPM